MKRILLMFMGVMAWDGVLGQFFSTPPTIDGTADAGYSTSGAWSLGWDDTYLYVRYDGGAANEPAIMYFDVNPIIPVSGGANSNGSLSGQLNWGITPTLPFRSDFMIYWESNFAEFRTSNSSNGWTSATTIGTSDRSNTGNASREIRLAWTSMGLSSRPAAFNWYGYANSRVSPGFIFNNAPGENPGGSVASPRINYYFTVSNTNSSGTTNPFARKSFEHRAGSDIFLIGSNTFFDITNNSNNTTNRIILENNSLNFTIDVNGTAHLYGGIVVNSSETFRINENANVIVNPNGFIANNSSTVTYNSSNTTLSYQTGGSYNVSGEWPIVNPPANIVVNTAGTNLIISDTRIASGNLTISTGCSTTINATGRMTVTGNLTNNGTLTLSATNESTYAQLLTSGTVTGNVTVQRAVTGSTAGWRFFSPATSGTQNNLGTGLLFAAGGPANVINLSNGSPNAWQGVGGNAATALTPGRGYGVYFGTDGVNGTSTSGTINTTGSIQTSNVTVSGLTNGNSGSSFGWALVGNPFTAGFNFGDATNTKTNIDNTVWIWNPTSNGGSGGYASYNYTTSTSSPSDALNGVIPPTQGFIVKVNNASPVLTMATAARTTATPNAQMRTASVLNRMYLTATNTQNGFNDELALVSWPTASTTFESDVDALKLNSFTSNAVNFSSKSSDNRLLSINSTSVWNDQLSIPLHIACTDTAAMKIEANLQEVDATLSVILEDRFLNRNHNLRQGAYQFAHVPSQADRFVVHFASLATSVQNSQLDKLFIYSASESLFVKGVEGAYELVMFDMQGRKVKAFVGNSDQEWNISELPKGAYVVHAQLADGVKSFKVVR